MFKKADPVPLCHGSTVWLPDCKSVVDPLEAVPMSFPSTLSGRLLFGVALVLIVFALVSSLAVFGLSEYQDARRVVRQREECARSALLLGIAIRREWLDPESDHSGEPTAHPVSLRGSVKFLSRQIRQNATEPGEAGLLDEIRVLLSELEAISVPNSPENRREVVRRVEAIEILLSRLSRSFESSINRLDDQTTRQEWMTYLCVLGIIASEMVLTIGVGLYLGRTISRPMAVLGEGAMRLASGDLSVQIELETRDEFGRLAQQINQMTVSLREQRERLLQIERLAAIGRFAAGIAHEINNPLGVILGYLRVLRKETTGRVQEDLEIVQEEAVRCQEIVEGLLDLARPTYVEFGRVNLLTISREAVAGLSGPPQELHTIYEIEGIGLVVGNAKKLRQVLTNLLKNASEASGQGGRVNLSLGREDPAWVTLTVVDDGPGLVREDARRLFEPFYTTKPGGTGLGLAVSRAIVQAHGGVLEGSTLDEGGAMFLIRLPRWVEGVPS